MLLRLLVRQFSTKFQLALASLRSLMKNERFYIF